MSLIEDKKNIEIDGENTRDAETEKVADFLKNKNKLIAVALIFILIIFFIVGIFLFKKFNKMPKSDDEMGINNKEMGDYFYNQASNNDSDAFVILENNDDVSSNPDSNLQTVVVYDSTSLIDNDIKKKNKNITPSTDILPIIDVQSDILVGNDFSMRGRVNPFWPLGELPVGNKENVKSLYDLITPPEVLSTDIKPQTLMKTYISGIMYDSVSPSAIINLNGIDQLVKKGDMIEDYKIINISKDKVVVKQGANIMKVAIGETIDTGAINRTDIYNLEKRFAGGNIVKSSNKIEINVKK